MPVPIEERLAFLERDSRLSFTMIGLTLAYLSKTDALSMEAFETWMLERLRALPQEPLPEAMFRRQRLTEYLAEARAVLASAAPHMPGETSP